MSDETLEVHALLADQRRRCRLGEPYRVEIYLSRFPELRDDRDLLLDLIYNEVIVREEGGEAPALAEYEERFPDLADALAGLFKARRAAGPKTTLPPAPRPEPGPAWPVLEHYEVVDVLGEGGMGVVYRARDRKREVFVAVKTMRQADAVSVGRFKQEFRGLLDVSHPNLISLHELISDGRGWYIVMEYIDGTTLLDYVRSGPPLGATSPTATGPMTTWSAYNQVSATRVPAAEPGTTVRNATSRDRGRVPDRPAPLQVAPAAGAESWARLRAALRQLAEGLSALHQAGNLHRDIKPSNVMVTRKGRVVVMDFGLITTPTSDVGDHSTEGNVVGTAAYMSPEQAAGLRLSEASDWYSVGVILYEALTGRRPFGGRVLDILMDKQRFDPPAPGDLVADTPADLNALCSELLRRDPRARPSGREVLARLGSAAPEPVAAAEPLSTDSSESAFVGREAHLDALAEALAASAEGRTVVVCVHGPSGVGKSALVHTFLSGLTGRGEAVVLAGRCYERESVPYKALDSLIDALSRHLRHLPGHEAGMLLPRDVGPLARVFPVLRRVGAVTSSPRRAAESPDPQELRRRAYAALRELLARLGDRSPLVLALDDLQWADTDSMAVLTEILRPPDTPSLLLLACYRDEDAENPTLRNALAPPGADLRDLAVGPLSAAESRDLARRLMGAGGAEAERQAEAVARESGGNPLFVAELARSGEGGRGPVALDEVLWSRVARLPDDARRLLEVVAVSGGPIRPAVAWQSLEWVGDERTPLALLRAGRLIRGAGGSSDVDRVETYHDRVRETVVAHLSADALADCHRRLALALDATGTADHEVLAVHFRGAGEGARAAAKFTLAARQAAEALAFDRASSLYRQALALIPPGAAEVRGAREALADALANAGRGADAASEYLSACEGATVAEALELRRRAAMQFLISGHIDRGLDALRDVLAAIGMTLPRSPRRALASLLWRRAVLRLRGLGFRPRDPSEVAAVDLTRIDVCWSAAVGLSNVDWVRGADFQARGLLLALRAGEPYRVARALAVEAAQNSTAGPSVAARTAALIEKARVLVQSAGEPYGVGMVILVEGISAYLEGRWLDALGACDRAETVFRDECVGVAWELDTAHAYALWSLSHLGRWAELARRFPVLIGQARERGDLYAAMNLSTYILSVVRLADDDPEAAREETRRVTGQWSQEGYHVQHNDLVWATVQIDLYCGDGAAAWGRITAHWPTLTRSLLLQVQFIRIAMLGLRGRCGLAWGTPAALRSAGRDADRLRRERLPWADAQAHMIRAALDARAGRPGEAAGHLRAASSLFHSCDMALWAAVADRRLGQSLGGAEGDALVRQSDALMSAQSIRRPDRVADLYAPGFLPG